MTITEHQREIRSRHIGSSDMAAVMGLDPWRTGYDVWLDKTGRVDPVKETDAMRRGNHMESALLSYAQDELGALRRNQRRVHARLPLAANIDAIATDHNAPVEAKSTSFRSAEHHLWGRPGTDEVPERVLVQAHVHMMCLGDDAGTCFVPVYIDDGFAMYRVDRHRAICDAIAKSAESFWRCVTDDAPPESSDPSLDAIERRVRVPDKAAEVERALIEIYLKRKAELEDAESALQVARRDMLEAADDAELITGHPDFEFTYFQQNAKRLSTKQLRKDYPEAAAACTHETTYRVLRKRKARA